jgi:hypothetical protein
MAMQRLKEAAEKAKIEAVVDHSTEINLPISSAEAACPAHGEEPHPSQFEQWPMSHPKCLVPCQNAIPTPAFRPLTS